MLEHARQLGAHAVVFHHQAGGAVHEACGYAHVFGLVLERFFELGQQGLDGLGGFFGGFFLGLVLQLAQIDRAFGHALQGRVIKVGQVVQRPLVHAVGHEQDFDAFFLEHFELRAVFGGGQVVGGDVVNRLLAFFHARLVVGQRHDDRVAAGGGKAQQLGQAVFVGVVLAHAFFEHGAKLCVKLAVFAELGLVFVGHHVGHAVGRFRRLVVFGQVFEHAQDALGAAFADGFDVAAFLQQFTAHVQGQIGRIDHAFDKAQVVGHERFGVVHDEHALHIQLDTGGFFAVVQVHGRFAGDVEQLRVFGAAFHAVVRVGQRRFHVVADLLVEVVVLLLADVLLGARPDGVGLVDGFPFAGFDHGAGFAAAFFIVGVNQRAVFPLFLFHLDGQADVVRIFADDALDLPGLGVVLCVVAQVQGDAGATVFAVDGFHLKRAAATGAAVADPAHAFGSRQTGTARFHRDLVGHDKARVKAHAKLADELRIRLLVAAEFGYKVFGAALGNRAEVVDGLLLTQANAVVGDGERLGFFVKGDADFEFGVAFKQLGCVDRLKAQLVAGV